MAVANVQEFPIHMHQTTNYDIVAERLGVGSDPPESLIVHTAGFDDAASVFSIFNVWEAQEQGERFQVESSTPDRHTGTAVAKFHDERDILAREHRT